MSLNRKLAVVGILWVAVLGCSDSSQEDGRCPTVAATNSTLECAAREFVAAGEPVFRLAEPGMCPGHFDVRPSQVATLRRCRVLLRLDFQKSLDAKLAGAQADGLSITEVAVPGGLCVPESYMAICRQTADALMAAGVIDKTTAEQTLIGVDSRVAELADNCGKRAEHIAGMPVIASVHQEAFCRWVGLNVIATFSGADTAGVRQIDDAVRKGEQAGVRMVIANLPEGRRIADALAARLGAEVVVLGNFPAMDEGQSSFDDLVVSNTDALLEATAR